MKNKDLQLLLRDFPDEMKVAITTLNKESGDISSYTLTDDFYLSCMDGGNISNGKPFIGLIVNHKQHKINIREELKKDFIELLTGCTLSFEGDDINYQKDDILLFYYRKNKDLFGVRYNIWSNFKSKYNLNPQELKDLLVVVVEEVLNYKEVRPMTW